MSNLTPTESQWRGHTRYQCPACPYNTLDRDRIDQHITSAHNRDPGPIVRRRIRRDAAQQRADERKAKEVTNGETGRDGDKRARRVQRGQRDGDVDGR